MKNSILIIMLFFLSEVLLAQVDSPGAINWDDPVYNDFFNESCGPQNIEKSATVRTIVKWFQDDLRWKNLPYGTCSTIGAQGCYLTCIAMMLSSTFDYINPEDLENFVSDNSYMDGSCNLYADLIIRNRPDPTNPSPMLQPNGRQYRILPDIEKIKTTLNREGFVVAHVNSCGHFILIYDYGLLVMR